MSTPNPYTLPVSANGTSPMSIARRTFEPMIAEHMEGFGKALDGNIPRMTPERTRAHTLLRVAGSAYTQAAHVSRELIARQNPLSGQAAFEAALGSSTLLANVTSFITQMIHMSLEVYPRLIASRLVSVQPFTQPSGYVFFMNRLAKDNGPGGSGAGRQLSTLSTFDSTYSVRSTEGQQVKAVGMSLDKTLVEVSYRALMHQQSHEVDVALRSQFGIVLEGLGDLMTAEELAWEVDREIVDAVTAFAATNPRGDIVFDPTAAGAYSGYSPSEQQAYDKRFARVVMSQAQIEMSADIFRTPNWYVGGTNVALLLAKSPEVTVEKSGDPNYWDQVRTQGSLIASGRMSDGSIILHDPQMDPDTMICGHVDNMNPFYCGYAFCPFGLASLLTAAFQDPDTLLTKKARALAYAKVGVRAAQFRKIRLGTS